MWRKPRREKTMRKMSLTVSILGAFLTAALLPLAGRAGTYDLTIAKTAVNVSGKPGTALTVNGQLPGPALLFNECEDVVLNVKTSDARRVGKECVIMCRSRWSPYHYKKK